MLLPSPPLLLCLQAMMLHVFCNVYGVSRTMAMENVIGGFLSGLASITWKLKVGGRA